MSASAICLSLGLHPTCVPRLSFDQLCLEQTWQRHGGKISSSQITKLQKSLWITGLLWQVAGVLSRWRGQFYMLDKAPKSLFQKGSKKAILLSLWTWAHDHVIGLFEKRNKKYKAVKPWTSSGQDCSGASSSSWNWREIEFAVLSTFSSKESQPNTVPDSKRIAPSTPNTRWHNSPVASGAGCVNLSKVTCCEGSKFHKSSSAFRLMGCSPGQHERLKASFSVCADLVVQRDNMYLISFWTLSLFSTLHVRQAQNYVY